jgi:two-component system cell cycle sensor histidine kinase/response regulator CckA
VTPLGRDGEDVPGPDRAGGATILLDDGRRAGLEALAALIAESFADLLAPVLGNVTLLEEALPDGHPLRPRAAGIKEAAAAARAFAQRLALLDPKRQLALREVDSSALLRDCGAAVRDELPPEVVVDCAPTELADVVRVDRHQIARALVELARNGQEAMGGAGTLRIDVSPVEGGPGRLATGRWVRLRVRDGGCGMEAAKVERAFEPLVTSKVPAGLAGLGLPLVAATVRRHGGLLEVESWPGAGTAISILLPSEARGARERERTPTAEPVTADPAGAGAHLLLVEDNPMVRRSIEATLRVAGYQVSSVDSGRRCLEAVGQLDRPLDLLISDVVMPEMSGEEMIDRVHELRPDLPVLFISGYDRSTLARRKSSVPSEHFLQKPFDSDDLFAAVREAIASGSGHPGG